MANRKGSIASETPVTTTMALSGTDALAFAKSAVSVYQRSSIKLVCSLSAVFFAYTYPADAKDRMKLEDIKSSLMEQLNESGLKQSSVYRYISIARDFCAALMKEGEFSAEKQELMRQTNPQKVTDRLFALAAGLTKVKEPSVDALVKALHPDAVAAPTGNQGNTGNRGANNRGGASKATSAKPNAIAPRLVDDKATEVFAQLSEKDRPKAVDTMATVIGKLTMGKRLIDNCSVEEMQELRAYIDGKLSAHEADATKGKKAA